MHRMLRYTVMLTLSAGLWAGATRQASADLLKPGATRSYPDIAADINGQVHYNYDEANNVGVFSVTNTPYLIAGGNSSSSEYSIVPNSSDGIRMQMITVKLDSTGQIVADAGNMYSLYGTINTPTETFSGLLLQGTPTAFGSLDLGNGLGVDIFDANIDITGGSLAKFFGATAYMRITPELESTFAGSFTEDFSALKATSNTRAYGSPEPFPIPEPSAIAVLLAGGLVVVYRRHRRRAA
jgi:hypothetical protein